MLVLPIRVAYSQYWCCLFVLPILILPIRNCVGEQADQSGELFDKCCGTVGVYGEVYGNIARKENG